MSNYIARIANGGSVSLAYEEWALEREERAIRTLRSRTAPMEDVRAAQAHLEILAEVRRLREECRLKMENQS